MESGTIDIVKIPFRIKSVGRSIAGQKQRIAGSKWN